MEQLSFKVKGRAALRLAGSGLMIWAASTAAPATELATAWVEGLSNKVRLIAGTAGGGPRGMQPATYAGIEISMSPGFKTYWRNPGEAGGVPPEFDFSGSENLALAEVFYPAPHRTKDKAGENIAYKDHVIFPVAVTAKDKAAPIKLRVKASYGVCKDICIPAEADVSIQVPANAGPSTVLEDALLSVPVVMRDPTSEVPQGQVQNPRAVIDPAKDPALTKWRTEDRAGKPTLVLEVNDPAGPGGDAFLFSSDGLYMPMTRKLKEIGTTSVFEADLSEGASAAELKGKTISVTLTGTKGQSETFIQLP